MALARDVVAGAPQLDDLVAVTGDRRGVVIGIDGGNYSVLLIDPATDQPYRTPGGVLHVDRSHILGIIAVVLMRDPTFEDLDKP